MTRERDEQMKGGRAIMKRARMRDRVEQIEDQRRRLRRVIMMMGKQMSIEEND